MPIYEYKCPNCGNVSEVWQKSFEGSTELCEKCGDKMKKVISQNTFLLKGAGWYVTDYGTKAQKEIE